MKEKTERLIHNFVFVLIIILIVFQSYRAYLIYQDVGFSYCVDETDTLTGETERFCFDSARERDEYISSLIYPINLDNKYINEYINIGIVD
jgi:hypothetical protein